MRKRLTLFSTVFLCFFHFGVYSSAELITTLNFDNTIWDVNSFRTDSANAGGGNVQSGGSITADKGPPGSGSVGWTVSLTGSISTSGFQDIELHFTLASNILEWNAQVDPDGTTEGTDGLGIGSTQGVDFQPFDGNFSESVLDAGLTFTPSTSGVGGSDLILSFDASANNSAITNLQMTFQVDANTDVLAVSGFEIHGTPEPTTIAMFGIAMAGIGFRRRK